MLAFEGAARIEFHGQQVSRGAPTSKQREGAGRVGTFIDTPSRNLPIYTCILWTLWTLWTPYEPAKVVCVDRSCYVGRCRHAPLPQSPLGDEAV